MDILEQRYLNFQQFSKTVQPDNDFVRLLQTTPLNVFLQTLKSKSTKNKSVTEIRDLILEKAGIDPSKVEKPVLDKFYRYVAYFDDVIKVLE